MITSHSQDCGSQSQNCGSQSQNCGSKSQNCGSKSQNCGSKSQNCGSQSQHSPAHSNNSPTQSQCNKYCKYPELMVFTLPSSGGAGGGFRHCWCFPPTTPTRLHLLFYTSKIQIYKNSHPKFETSFP